MRFKKLANHLLDLGKRNKLLNYKEIGARSINVLNKEIKNIYRSIIDGKEYTILLIDDILETQKQMTLDSHQYDVLQYTNSKVFDIINPILKPRQLICYRKGHQQIKVLNTLYKEYKFSINEKGINSLYMAFGFVEYEEESVKYKAPLLLIPLKYTKDIGKYKVKEAEDEVILNPTLEYYFQQQFNVKIPDITSQDQELDDYFETVKAVLNSKMTLVEECAIGVFSFLKMNMYNDLINNESKVLQNKNILSLVDDYKSEIEPNENNKVYPVDNCDSSQLDAIKLACSGESFVLQGPPGSGKSQTITNIIASLIANDKKVLFVSEKLAALEVVYNNLKKVGLHDFAIELHSSKANKKEFIDNLYKTAILPKYSIDSNTNEDVEAYEEYKKYLEEYITILHSNVLNESYTIYDLLCEYFKISIEPINYKINNISEYKMTDLKKIMESLNDYSTLIAPIGYDYKEQPFTIFASLTKEYIEYECRDDLKKSLTYLHKLSDLKENLNKIVKLRGKKINSINDFYDAIEFVEEVNKINIKSNVYFNKHDREYLINLIDKYYDLKNSLPNISCYNEDILKEPLDEIYRYIKLKTSFVARMLDSRYKAYKNIILQYRSSKTNYDQMVYEIEKCINYRNISKEMALNLNKIEKLIGSKDLIIIQEDLKQTEKYRFNEIDFKKLNNAVDCVISYKNYQSEDVILNKLGQKIDHNKLNLYNCSIELAASKLKDVYLNVDKLGIYYLVTEEVKEIEGYHQIDYLDHYLSLKLDLKNLATQFQKEFLKSKVLECFNREPLLRRFSADQFDNKVNEFAKLDEKILRINRDIIISKNSSKRPDDIISSSSAFGILSHEHNKIKRQRPIRQLLDTLFKFVLDIKPVFLMSPLSVSTYLSSDNDIFDCVIFDEASQIFAWDALGSIYRGKQCIIIGDSKQMPPSNFFGASNDNSDALEEEDECESILDMASICFKTKTLRWHYRSRSEELITFSNKHFYDDSLITIPQASPHKKGFGIDFIYLNEGRYNATTRTNVIEAREICQMVFDHYKTSTQSLGVVAFSKVQAELIEEMIEIELARHPELREYFKEDAVEPFFVKNLETVQGDERDRIIFSICYGYNSDGKFYQRFGPLNNLGGERRLNVAITRAKYNVTVVSSIRYLDIKPSESLGCQLLYEYLKFCENVVTQKNSIESENGIINKIKDVLEKNNYDVLTNFGASSFKIGLAVKKKEANTFLAAIMVDTKDNLNKNTTEQNRLEELLIKRQGWRYYKIYAPAWFNNYEHEKDKLLAFLKSNHVEEIEEPEEEKTFLTEDTSSKSLKDMFDKYEGASIEELQEYLLDNTGEDLIKYLITKEQPITEEYLYRKVANVLGNKSITSAVRNFMLNNMPDDVINKSRVYWTEYKDVVKLRLDSDRSIDEIPVEELMDGIYTILKYAVTLTRKECYKKLVELLGYERVTEGAKKKLDDAVLFLSLYGKIVINGDNLSL